MAVKRTATLLAQAFITHSSEVTIRFTSHGGPCGRVPSLLFLLRYSEQIAFRAARFPSLILKS